MQTTTSRGGRLTILLLGAAGLLSSCAEKSFVGQKLPALQVTYLKGGPPQLAGKPLIIEFWATWCPPCRQSIPHLNAIYQQYKNQGLEIVGITDEQAATVRQFMQQVPMDYPVALDPGGRLAQYFGITGIPHALLVNKAGVIVWTGHPMELTAAGIAKVLP